MLVESDDAGGARAIDVEEASDGRFSSDPQPVFARWAEFVEWAGTTPAGRTVPLSPSDLGAPAPSPRQVFAIGLNYRDHAVESGFDLPDQPTVFTKYVTCLTGPDGEVTLSGDTVDWEVELVAVVGAEARNVPVDRGWEHDAGLTAGQDLSERTVQLAGPAPQFSVGKSFPGFGPTGPWLVTPDEFDDPDDLALGCSVNGESMQKSQTSELVFSVPALVASLSAMLPLLPGDVIFTGTPAGVGAGRNPRRFLRDGDELVSSVEGIGTLRQRLVRA